MCSYSEGQLQHIYSESKVCARKVYNTVSSTCKGSSVPVSQAL